MILADPMVWKEYRAQRSFWLAIAGFAIGLMFLFMWLLGDRDGLDAPWVIALTLPMFFALGSSAVAFASEREEGTIDLLRIIAARTSRVFLAKVSFSLAGTVAMCALLLAVATFATWNTSLFSSAKQLLNSDVLFAALFLVQLLAWGFFFSLMNKKVLTAVCLTGVVSPLFAGVILDLSRGYLLFPNNLALLIVAPVLALTSYWLTARLITGRSWSISLPRPYWRRTVAIAELERLAGVRETAPAWRRTFTRLLWLEFRNLLSVGHILWVVGLLVLVFIPLGIISWPDPGRTIMGVVLSSLLTGVWTFQAEEGRRTRFLADHGLSPCVVWLSKQLVSGLLLWVVAAPFLVGVEVANKKGSELLQRTSWSFYHPDVPGASAVAFAVTLACLSYAVGQFASMLIRRSVTAGFVGAMLSAMLGWWTWLMFELEVSLLISAAPVFLILMATTLIWSRNWLLEEATWRSWRRLALALGAALAAAWGAIGLFRIYEVPHPAFVDDIAALRDGQGRPITADEAATAELYRQARLRLSRVGSAKFTQLGQYLRQPAPSSLNHATSKELDWLAENEEALKICLAATERPSCAISDPARQIEDPSRIEANQWEFTFLAELILLSARELESHGQLDEALSRYVSTTRLARHVASRGTMEHWRAGIIIEELVYQSIPGWAAHPDQTPELIESGSRRVRQEVSQFPSLRDALLTQQFMVRRILKDDWPEMIAKQFPAGEVRIRTVINVIDRMFPWERHRSLRVLDLYDASEIRCLDMLEAAIDRSASNLQQWAAVAGAYRDIRADEAIMLNRRRSRPQHVDDGNFFDAVPSANDRQERIPWNWVGTTPLLKTVIPPDHSRIWQIRLHRELTVRIALLKLKLAAFKKAHGEYPDLAEIASHDQIAIDPYTGAEFGFRPKGYPTPVRVVNGWTYEVERVEADQPIVWSAGPGNVRRFVPISAGIGAEKDQAVPRLNPLTSPVAFTLP